MLKVGSAVGSGPWRLSKVLEVNVAAVSRVLCGQDPGGRGVCTMSATLSWADPALSTHLPL